MKKFAVVGDKESAKLHAKNIARIGKLIAVCGDDETGTIACEHSAKAYRVFDEMLAAEKETDVVVVCSPVGHHAEHIIKSLQAGKDVLCESPLCITKAAAWQIIETEKYCGRSVYLIQAHRFYKAFDRIKKQMDNNPAQAKSFVLSMNLSLRKSFYAGERGKLFPGGGLLYDPFGSIIESMLEFFGEIDSVAGFKSGGEKEGNAEHFGVASLKMKNGILGTVQWSGDCNSTASLKIISDNGSTDTDLDFPNLLALGVHEESEKDYKEIYEALFQSPGSRNLNFSTTLDGAKTVEAIEKIYKALC